MGTSQEALARRTAAALREAGHEAFFVGGCVRDLLLGREPKDWDITTVAPPEQVLRLFPEARLVGARFGVVLVTGADGVQVEVATYRRDHEYADGRRPARVTFETDVRQDVQRRDFTINALLMCPLTGEVVDHVGGRRDLQWKLIRAIGDPEERFREDHLRLLRALRFAARLGFEIESETEAAILQLHPLIRDVSPERVRMELTRILTEGGARRGFELLDRTELLRQVLPEVAAMKGVEQPPEYHPEGDVWTHTLLMLEGMHDPTQELAWGVLLHDVGKPPTFRVTDRIRFNGHVEEGVNLARRILTRLRFSNDEIQRIEALVGQHMRFMDVPRMKDSTLKRFLRMDHFDEHLELHRLDCLCSHRDLTNWEFVRGKRDQIGEAASPEPLLRGRDLIAAGFAPGPAFKPVLEAVEDAQLDGKIRTREEALALAIGLLTGQPASLGGSRNCSTPRG